METAASPLSRRLAVLQAAVQLELQMTVLPFTERQGCRGKQISGFGKSSGHIFSELGRIQIL